MSDPVAPDWLNNGDNAWQLTAATLVGMQSVPGLVVLYAGIVKTKWAVNSAFMALYAFAMVLVVWVIYGYEMGFGGTMIPGLVGIPKPVLSIHTELEQVCFASLRLTTQVTKLQPGSASSRANHSSLPKSYHGVFPICLRRHHCSYHSWGLSGKDEFQGILHTIRTLGEG